MKEKKKRKTGLVLFLVCLILLLAGGIGFYFYERSQPSQELEQYLTSIQKMDFAAMETYLQSADLSALDNADIRSEVFESFFQTVNQKLTWKITKNQFHFQNGTAEVTAQLRYIDGSAIYRETVTEFLRQIVSSAFSGETLTEEETQSKLASILNEKARILEDQFQETEIVYPMIKVDNQWKVTSLDEQTVTVMSANFKSVEEEIYAALNDTNSDSAANDNSTVSMQSDSLALSTDRFSLHYLKNVLSTDFGQEPCILVYYEYTNNSSSPSSAMVDVNFSATQNGTALEAAIPQSTEDAMDAFMKEIQPGETITVCQAFSLLDMSPVTLQAKDAFGLDSSASASQVLNLQ